MFLVSLLFITIAIPVQNAGATDIDRSNWTVTTQTATNYDYVLDDGSGSGSPQEMFDEDPATFLSLIKPGKGGIYNVTDPQPADFIPSFTIDMQSPQTFNYFTWTHRSHTNNYLRVFAVKMYGSNTGNEGDFTSINNGALLWIPNLGGYTGSVNGIDETTYAIVVPQSTFQYVKVSLEMWSDIYNGQHPDYTGAGTTSGTCLQIGEFGLGKYEPRIMPVADLSFGEVLLGGTAEKKITVSGISLTGGVTAAISGDDANAFTITPSTPADGKYPFTIQFAPTDKKACEATLTLSSAGVEPVTAQLTGNADFDLPVLISSEDASDEHWYYIQFYRKAAANLVWSLSDTTQVIVQDTLKADALRDNQQWKICGNWDEGYYLINKTGTEIAYNEEASEDGLRPADRYLQVASGVGELFDFVRFGTTEDWQFYNRDYAYYNPSASFKYVNDQSGKFICHYLSDDAGNRLRFIPAGIPAIAVNTASVAFEIPQGETATQSLSISGLNLTGAITASFDGEDAGVFSFGENGSTVPAIGGTLSITFAPVAVKMHTATLILTSGTATLTIPVTGNSDLSMPTISTLGNEVWYYIQFARKSPPTSTTYDLAWTAFPENDLRYDTRVMQKAKVESNTDQHWKLEGDWTNGYRIINRGGGAASFDETTLRVMLIEEEAFGDRHLFKRQSATADWQLQVVEKADGTWTYLNDWNGVNGDGSIGLYQANDGGNTLRFIPVDLTSIPAPSFDANDVVVAVKYYTLQGVEIQRPATTGVYIVQNWYASGKVKATKTLFIVK
jgi:hypothetical protein